jgi:uncharacterized repeat protein (TIGR01451 family)
MNRRFERLPRVATAAACAILLLTQTAVRGAERQVLQGHLRKAVAGLQPMERLAATNRLKLAITLPLKNAGDLTNLLGQLYNPASPSYRHYLTPAEFAEKFGPSQADYDAVINFAVSNHLTVTGQHPNRTVLDVEGSVGDVERTFNVRMQVYQHPSENRKFYAPDQEPSVSLSTPLLHIDGLDTFVLPKPLMRFKPVGPASPKSPGAGTGSGPFGTFQGYDFRNAYIPGVTLTGAGQNIGLFELDGYYPSDISAYEKAAGLPNASLKDILIDGFNGLPFTSGGDGEVSLDIDMDIAMAPGVSQILVYEATNGFTTPITDMLNKIATDDAANQISSSWLIGDDLSWEQIYLQYAAQGQSFYQASGDNGAFVWSLQDQQRTDDPNITLVGGTTLTTTGPLGNWSSETVWNWNSTGEGTDGSGGGISPNYPIPSWQLGINMNNNGGSTTQRNIPDVALTADNIFIIANQGEQMPGIGGTSAAAPLWAAFTALVNQQAASAGDKPVGFLNPTIYGICKGPLYNVVMHDIITGNDTNVNSPNSFFATNGYDLCTGWGTPSGSNLINTLAPVSTTPVLAISTNIITGGNGNGVIDFDECNNLTVILTNEGNAIATGVEGVLTSDTPGVIVAQNTVTFPNLPPHTSAASLSSFTISTEPTFVCGTPVNLTLVVKTAQVIQTNSIALSSGVLGSPDIFGYTGPPGVTIPINFTGLNSTINVQGLESLGKITVSAYITAAFDAGLILQLTAPNGVSVLLSANNGGLGANYGAGCSLNAETTFDDAAPQSITLASPPYVGSFSPQVPLSTFNLLNGTNLNGIWTLNVIDEFPGDAAQLNCWSLNISPEICLDGGGECPGSDLSLSMTAGPNPVVVDSNLVYTIVVSNAGPSDAQNVEISQTLPAGVGFVTTSNYPVTASQSGSTLNLNVGTLPVYASATVSVVTIATIPGPVTSVASVGFPGTDPNPNNNSASVTTTVTEPGADMAVSMTAAPSIVLQGAPLTYTIQVTNNGPFTATQVMLNNTLPPNVNLISTSTTEGTVTPDGTIVTIGTVPNGSNVVVTIVVSPTTTGNITAGTRVSVGPLQVDPVTFNNTATATVTVGPSADLAVSGFSVPTTILSGANYTNVATVLNNGPSTATSVTFSQTLPAGVSFVSSSVAAVVVTNGAITWNIGTLTNGASLSITNVLKSPVLLAGVQFQALSSTLSVFGQPGDANTNNNVSILQALVEPPTINIVAASAVLTSESFQPPDGAVDPGETVQLMLNLQNAGNVNTTNVIATLQTTGGVTLPSGSQSYGALLAGATPIGRLFSFTANSTNGGTVVATLQLQDGSSTLPPVTFTFYMPVVTTFWNTNRIDIPSQAFVPQPDSGPANPYPSLVNVSNVTGFVSKVTVTASNMSHSYPNDVAMILVGPDGQDVALMVNAAANALQGMVNQTVVFDQTASQVLPASGQLVAGAYRPADYKPSYSLSNAPAAPYSTNLATFSGISPNGVWSLYAYDTANGDAGGISNGWAVTVTTITPVNQAADISANIVAVSNQLTLGNSATFLVSITNNGPNAASAYVTNTLPAGLSFVSTSASSSNYTQNGQVVLYTTAPLAPGAGIVITNVVTTIAGGMQTNTVVVSSSLPDPNLANNAASAVVAVNMPFADVSAGVSATPNPVVVGSNVVYTLVVTNLGPSSSLGVFGSFSLNSLAIVSALPSQGSVVTNGSAVQCNFGSLAAGNIATVVVTASPLSVGSLSNVWTVSTSDQDTNSANNSVTAVVSVINPVPIIVAGGDTLVAQGGNLSNGAINANETVTVAFTLNNIGSAPTTNLTAALQANANLAPVTTSQSYGAIAPGASAAQSYSFTAQGLPGAAVKATLVLTDGAASLGNVSFIFYIPSVTNYSQSTGILIPEFGPATPYPSQIQVTGLANQLVTKVTATLNGFTHTFPHDVNVVLASPDGEELFLMSHVGGAYSVTNLTLTFDDAATQTLPATQLASGIYLPTVVTPYNPLPGIPSASSASAMAIFDGSHANGNWSLYVFDDTQGNSGVISSGWALGLTAVDTVNPAARLEASMIHAPDPVFSGNYLSYLITITNLGPDVASNVVLSDTLPASVAYSSATSSQGTVVANGGVVTCNFGSLGVGATVTATIRVIAGTAGTIINTATVTTASTDLYLADSTTANMANVLIPPVALLAATNSPNGVQLILQGQPSQNYGIQVSTDLLNWTTISTNTAGVNGIFTFSDSNTNSPGQFYRAIRIPQ